MPRLEIVDTAYGAGGVGRLPSGKTIFVPYTVTGDIVEAEIISEKSSYALGKLVHAITPSVYRTAIDCPYFAICGGCHFRHIAYSHQLEIKAGILKKLLKLSDIEVISGETEHYRVRAVFRSMEGRIGFYKAQSRELVPVSSCKAVSATLFAAVASFAEKLKYQNFSLSVLEAEEGILAEIKGKMIPKIFELKDIPFRGLKISGIPSASVKGGKSKIIGDKLLTYSLKYGEIPVTFGSFFQSNRCLMETFLDRAMRFADGNILELYAGSGFFTSALRGKGNVLGIESDKIAAELGKNAGFPIERNEAFDFLKNTPVGRYDTIFLDPPRVGAGRGVMGEITRIKPKRIIYVSCDPMTLARDAAFLKEGWEIADAALIDMFPHTYHIETILTFYRR
jgi:23S rRNA (uracil1939-C5)-methyltransferase